jgi:hypothetical protein
MLSFSPWVEGGRALESPQESSDVSHLNGFQPTRLNKYRESCDHVQTKDHLHDNVVVVEGETTHFLQLDNFRWRNWKWIPARDYNIARPLDDTMKLGTCETFFI